MIIVIDDDDNDDDDGDNVGSGMVIAEWQAHKLHIELSKHVVQ